MIRHWNPIFIQSSTQYVTTLTNALYIFLYIDWKRPKCCISNILTVGTDEDYSRDACSMLNNIYKYTSFYNHLIYISVDGHLVPWGIISSVVRISALTWFIRYMYYWNFSSNAILIKTNFNVDQTAIMFRSFGFLAPREL
jgi:hypothetical protein